MKILVLSINYAPEQTGFGLHVAALCEHLVNQDHAVTVLTGFPFAPYWSRWPEYKGELIKLECVNGVRIVRLTHFIPRHAGQMLERVLMEGSFCLMAVWVLLTEAHSCWDVILYVGAQPSIAMLAKWIARVSHIPYVVNIQDLAARLDWLWQKICGDDARIDGVKINVQGMEIEVVRGMAETLAQQRPKLVIEVHRGINWNDLRDILKSAGHCPQGVAIEPIGANVSSDLVDDQSYEFRRSEIP